MTLTTGLTDSSGGFDLEFTGGFSPRNGAYYLEAVKGLGHNSPGRFAARVRTLIYWKDGWVSLSGTGTDAEVLVGKSTTAVAAAIALLKDKGRPVREVDYMGCLTMERADAANGIPDTYAPKADLPMDAFLKARSVVDLALGSDRDPLEALGVDAKGGFYLVTSGGVDIRDVQPSSAKIGERVRIRGIFPAGVPEVAFADLPSGRAIPVDLDCHGDCDATTLWVKVPEAAPTGKIYVRVGPVVAEQPGGFKVIPQVSGMTSFVRAGGPKDHRIRVKGTGFDPLSTRVFIHSLNTAYSPAETDWIDLNTFDIDIPESSNPGKTRATVMTAGGEMSLEADFSEFLSESGL